MYGEAERVLGLVLEKRRGEALIATKVLEHSASSALASIERSFKLLRTDVIDLLQIHNLAAWRKVTPALKKLQAEGRVRYLGITDYQVSKYPEMMEAMRTGDFDTIQIPYHLGERTCRRKVLPLARELGMGVIVMTPVAPLFNRDLLLGPLSRADLSFLKPYGGAHPGPSPPQVPALRPRGVHPHPRNKQGRAVGRERRRIGRQTASARCLRAPREVAVTLTEVYESRVRQF
jgi:diketogulonate reductase-like aldo/keto reductase